MKIRSASRDGVQRAYSQLTIKAVDEDLRVIEGVATTPNPDRVGDIVEPDGAEFTLPLPMLMGHDSRSPIGHVIEAKISKDGISIKAKLVKIAEEGALKNRLDEAWQSLKSGLVRGLSIGFRPTEDPEPLNPKDPWGALRFTAWEWLELSAVVIPANTDASITAIKQIDREARAAFGDKRTTVVKLEGSTYTGDTVKKLLKDIKMKTITEQIAALEAKRAASAARREEIQAKAIEENRTKDESEKEEFDTLSDEIKAIDDELVDLKLMEAQKVAKATPIKGKVATGEDDGAGRGGSIITVSPNVEKGIAFTRYVKALAMARGNVMHAEQIAKSNKLWMDTTPQVAQVLKTAVDAGDTTTSGWASELVYNQNLAAEFIELLRPQTIIGKLTGLTRVPFNVRMSGQDAGSSAYWVGQGKPVPVSKLNTLEVTLGIAKAAGLVVLTDELVRSSSPSAEMLVRNDLMGSISEFLDKQFVDPDFAAVSNVSPASITNGVTPVAPTGTTAAALRTDVQTLFDSWIQNNLDPTSGVWIMSPTKALAISLMRTALDQPEFPGITMMGGTFFGLPVVVSNSANQAGSPASGDMIILVNQKEVLLADDGQITIDASREASLEMLDNPTNQSSATATATSMVSMFQTNSVAIKAVRYINWKKRRTIAVAFVQHAAYVA